MEMRMYDLKIHYLVYQIFLYVKIPTNITIPVFYPQIIGYKCINVWRKIYVKALKKYDFFLFFSLCVCVYISKLQILFYDFVSLLHWLTFEVFFSSIHFCILKRTGLV